MSVYYPITPQTRRCTTLWNITVRKTSDASIVIYDISKVLYKEV